MTKEKVVIIDRGIVPNRKTNRWHYYCYFNEDGSRSRPCRKFVSRQSFDNEEEAICALDAWWYRTRTKLVSKLMV